MNSANESRGTGGVTSELRKLLNRLSAETLADADAFGQYEVDADLEAYEQELAAMLQSSSSHESTSVDTARSVDAMMASVLHKIVHLTPSEERVASAVHAHMSSSSTSDASTAVGDALFGVRGLVALLELCGAIVPTASTLESILVSAHQSVVVLSPSSDCSAAAAPQGGGGGALHSARDGWNTARHVVRAGLSMLSSRRRSTAASGGPPTMMTARSSSLLSTSRRGTSRASVTPQSMEIVPPSALVAASQAVQTTPTEKIFVSLPIFTACLRQIKRRQYDEVIAEAQEREHLQRGTAASRPIGSSSPTSGAAAARPLEDAIDAILASKDSLPPSSASQVVLTNQRERNEEERYTTADDVEQHKISEDLVDRFLQHKFGVTLFHPTARNSQHHHSGRGDKSSSDSDGDDDNQRGADLNVSSIVAARGVSKLQFSQNQMNGAHQHRSSSAVVGAAAVQDNQQRRIRGKKYQNSIGPMQLLTSLSPARGAAHQQASGAGSATPFESSSPFIRVRTASAVVGGNSTGGAMPKLWLDGDRSTSMSGAERSIAGGSGFYLQAGESQGAIAGESRGVRSSSVSPIPSGRTQQGTTPRSEDNSPPSAQGRNFLASAVPKLPPSLLLRPTSDHVSRSPLSSGRNEDHHYAPPRRSPVPLAVDIDFEASWSQENSLSHRGGLLGFVDVDGLHSQSPCTAGSPAGSPRTSRSAPSPLYGGVSTTSLKQLRKDSMIRKAQYNNQLAALKQSILLKKTQDFQRRRDASQQPPPSMKGHHNDRGQQQQRPQSASVAAADRFHSTHGNKNIYALRHLHHRDQGAAHQPPMQDLVIGVSASSSPMVELPAQTLPSSNLMMSSTSGSASPTQHIGNPTRAVRSQLTSLPTQRCHSAGVRGPRIAMAIRTQATRELQQLAELLACE